jgi:hypothetical protein
MTNDEMQAQIAEILSTENTVSGLLAIVRNARVSLTCELPPSSRRYFEALRDAAIEKADGMGS